jgi:hypothetical protein
MKRGLYAVPGLSATERAAVTASRLAGPATKVSKVKRGLRVTVT